MKIESYIKKYDNIIDIDLCNDIIKNSSKKEFNPAKISDGEIDTKIRNCLMKPLNDKFEDKIFKAVSKILQQYSNEFEYFSLGLSPEDTGYTHLLYESSEKGGYKKHVDHFDLYPRVLSCSFLLNDNYEGGNLSFFEKKDEVIFPNKAGSAIVFPSNFCFPHAVLPVTKGNRHAIITWIH
tara:strand:+ start:3140 stop:3679 length:540 start_codon:yes stop_codon:yes gene_type:complete